MNLNISAVLGVPAVLLMDSIGTPLPGDHIGTPLPGDSIGTPLPGDHLGTPLPDDIGTPLPN